MPESPPSFRQRWSGGTRNRASILPAGPRYLEARNEVSQFTLRCRLAASYQFHRCFRGVAGVERLVTCGDTFVVLARIRRGGEPHARMRLRRASHQVRSVHGPEPQRTSGRRVALAWGPSDDGPEVRLTAGVIVGLGMVYYPEWHGRDDNEAAGGGPALFQRACK
jgi:hypothetical protein